MWVLGINIFSDLRRSMLRANTRATPKKAGSPAGKAEIMKRGKFGVGRNSFLSKVMVRLLGEEKGAVMMEYVIVAVLIAAACVVAVAMFGKTIVGMFDTAAKGAPGDHTGAKQTLDATQETQSQDAQAASEYHDSMHK